MADPVASPASAAKAPRRWQPERGPRRRWIAGVMAATVAAAIVAALVVGDRVASRTAERPRLMDAGADAKMDGGPAPRGRLPAGAELAAGTGAKLRLQWDDGILVDLGIEGRLAVRPAGLGIDLRDGILGALVSPLRGGRPFVVGTPFGEVLSADGQFSVILSSKVAIVHADAGAVRVRPPGGAERALAVGETARLEAPAPR